MGYVEEALEDAKERINRNNRLRGKAFERRVVAAFREAGFNCRRTPFSGAAVAYGKGDVEFLGGEAIFVECKNYKVDIIAMLDTTKYANLMQKAYEQAGNKVTTIAIRTTKGNNIIIIQKNQYIEWYIRLRGVDPHLTLMYGGVEFYIVPLEVGVAALASAYRVDHSTDGIG